MKKSILSLLVLTLFASVALTACGSEKEEMEENQNTNEESADSENMEDEEEMEEEEDSEPVPFSDVDRGIWSSMYDEDSNPDGFQTVELLEGTGSCIDDEGLFTEIVYTDTNLITTPDESFVDRMVRASASSIKFKPTLTSGEATCSIVSSGGVTTVDVSCEIEEEEVCTAQFKAYGNK